VCPSSSWSGARAKFNLPGLGPDWVQGGTLDPPGRDGTASPFFPAAPGAARDGEGWPQPRGLGDRARARGRRMAAPGGGAGGGGAEGGGGLRRGFLDGPRPRRRTAEGGGGAAGEAAAPGSPGRPGGARSLRGGEGEGTDLDCPICLGVINLPVTLATCGHAFCRQCLEDSLSRDRRCPLCRATVPGLPGDPVRPHVRHSQLLEDLLRVRAVVCPNEGCGITVSRDNLEAHVQACPRTVSECPLAEFGCPFVGNKAAREAHLESGGCSVKPIEAFARHISRRVDFQNARQNEDADSRRAIRREMARLNKELQEENYLLRNYIRDIREQLGSVEARLGRVSSSFGKVLRDNKGLLSAPRGSICKLRVHSNEKYIRHRNSMGQLQLREAPPGQPGFTFSLAPGSRDKNGNDISGQIIYDYELRVDTPFSEALRDIAHRHGAPEESSCLTLYKPLIRSGPTHISAAFETLGRDASESEDTEYVSGGELVNVKLTPRSLGFPLSGASENIYFQVLPPHFDRGSEVVMGQLCQWDNARTGIESLPTCQGNDTSSSSFEDFVDQFFEDTGEGGRSQGRQQQPRPRGGGGGGARTWGGRRRRSQTRGRRRRWSQPREQGRRQQPQAGPEQWGP